VKYTGQVRGIGLSAHSVSSCSKSGGLVVNATIGCTQIHGKVLSKLYLVTESCTALKRTCMCSMLAAETAMRLSCCESGQGLATNLQLQISNVHRNGELHTLLV
jgi:hypothetical protein